MKNAKQIKKLPAHVKKVTTARVDEICKTVLKGGRISIDDMVTMGFTQAEMDELYTAVAARVLVTTSGGFWQSLYYGTKHCP